MRLNYIALCLIKETPTTDIFVTKSQSVDSNQHSHSHTLHIYAIIIYYIQCVLNFYIKYMYMFYGLNLKIYCFHFQMYSEIQVKEQNFSFTFYIVFAIFAQQTMSYRNAQPILSDKLIALCLLRTLDSVVNKSIDRKIVTRGTIKRQRIFLFLHRIIFCV